MAILRQLLSYVPLDQVAAIRPHDISKEHEIKGNWPKSAPITIIRCWAFKSNSSGMLAETHPFQADMFTLLCDGRPTS